MTTETGTLLNATQTLETLFPVPPRCHTFRTQRHHYSYDTNTGEIVALDPVSVEMIWHLGRRTLRETLHQLVQEHGAATVLDRISQLVSLNTQRNPPLFSTKKPKNIRYCYDFPTFEYMLHHGMESLLLSVTDVCNMACRYCVYSGKYKGRSLHGNHFMSPETLQFALQYFAEHSSEATHRHVGFYGGEPTLAPDLLRYAAEYLQEKLDHQPYTVGVTTNFLKVDTDILRFLRAHNFIVYVSLDGPSYIQDRYRIAADGGGSFDRIATNLRRLKALDEEYYNNHVVFFATVTPPYRILDLRRFFENDALIPAAGLRYRFLDLDSPRVAFADLPTAFYDNPEIEEVRQEYLEEARKGTLTQLSDRRIFFLRTVFDDQFLHVYRRNRRQEPMMDTMFPGGICVPGKRKIYVRWDGEIFPCERMAEHSTLKIGDCHTGVDAAKAYKLCQDFAEMDEEQCAECWAHLMCDAVCLSHAFNEKGPDPARKKLQCQALRTQKARVLRDLCSVLEDNPHAFDFLDEMTVE